MRQPEVVWYAECERDPESKSRYRDPTLSRVFRREIDARNFNPRNGINKRVFKATVVWEEVINEVGI